MIITGLLYPRDYAKNKKLDEKSYFKKIDGVWVCKNGKKAKVLTIKDLIWIVL